MDVIKVIHKFQGRIQDFWKGGSYVYRWRGGGGGSQVRFAELISFYLLKYPLRMK